ncbi:MAG: sigma factor [Acidobacteriaceae bacterium]
MDPMDFRAIYEQIWRDERGRVLATLIRLLGSFDLAEEATQDAFAAALETWSRGGVPDNPRAWLVSAAAIRPSTACAVRASSSATRTKRRSGGAHTARGCPRPRPSRPPRKPLC